MRIADFVRHSRLVAQFQKWRARQADGKAQNAISRKIGPVRREMPAFFQMKSTVITPTSRHFTRHFLRLSRSRLMPGRGEDVILPRRCDLCMRDFNDAGYSHHAACTHSDHLGAGCLWSGSPPRHAISLATLYACQGPC